MTDYEVLKDKLEMAEVLTFEDDTRLEVGTINEPNGASSTVVFEFEADGELKAVFTEG